MSVMTTRFCWGMFFKDFPIKSVSAKQLEKLFVRSFNKNLEAFPPGVSPRDCLEHSFQRRWIRKTSDGRYYISDVLIAKIRNFFRLAA